MLRDEFNGHRHSAALPMSDDMIVVNLATCREREQDAAIETEIERFERLRALLGAPPNDLPEELAEIVEFVECTTHYGYVYDDETGEFVFNY